MLAYTLYSFYFVFTYTTSTNSMQFAYQVLVAHNITSKNGNTDYDVSQPAVRLIAVLITTGVCLLLYFSTRQSQFMNKITAILKRILLLALWISGAYYAFHTSDTSRSTQHSTASSSSHASSGSSSWARRFLIALFSFEGWENATLVSTMICRARSRLIGNCSTGGWRDL